MFPVIYSTLASQALVSQVLSQYKIKIPTSCQLWNRGLSDVYLVETKANPYILRVSHQHWRSQSDIEFELELLDFLRQRRIPVAYPLKTKDEQLFVEINAPEGKRYASLFIYAQGKVPLGDLDLSQSRKLGETVAKLHKTSADFRTNHPRQPLTLEYLLDDSFDAIAPYLQHRLDDLDDLWEIITKIKYQLQDFPQEYPFWVICWGDPHSGNAHFTKEGKVTLFDFDQCGYGWRAFEIAKFLQVSLRTGMSKPIREAFLEAYQLVQPLSDYELESLQAFTQTAHIWMWMISISSLRLHNYSKLDDSYFSQRLEQLKRLKSQDWQLF